jgi:urease accessory protein
VTLLVASKLIIGGAGLAPALLRRASRVALDWDTRQKSRFEALDSTGRRIGVFLPRGRIVRGGDVLVAEDGSLIVVAALDQPILVATASAATGAAAGALALAKAAYHLGNRHVPLEVRGDRLVLEPDHVLAELIERLGLVVETTRGPFEPEAGAYDGAGAGHDSPRHAHDHGGGGSHQHERDHEREHGHEHAQAHSHSQGHAHGPGCGHDHGNDAVHASAPVPVTKP